MLAKMVVIYVTFLYSHPVYGDLFTGYVDGENHEIKGIADSEDMSFWLECMRQRYEESQWFKFDNQGGKQKVKKSVVVIGLPSVFTPV